MRSKDRGWDQDGYSRRTFQVCLLGVHKAECITEFCRLIDSKITSRQHNASNVAMVNTLATPKY